MVATKGQQIALGVLAGLIIGSGIALILLYKFLYDSLNTYGYIGLFWIYGLPVLVTGVMCIVAAATKTNVTMGIFMAVSIICLIVQGVFAVLALLSFYVLMYFDPDNCYQNQNGMCQCDFTYSAYNSLSANLSPCESVNPIHLSRAACAMIIISWGLMLAACIVSCAACCSRRTDQPGTVIVASPGYQMQQQVHNYNQYQPPPVDSKY